MATRDKLVGLLTKLQRWLRMCNGYIRDFIQVCEIPSEQVETMELVISARIKKKHDHGGVYNEPMGFKEVQVLMEDSPTDRCYSIVVRKWREDGALQYVADVHRSFDFLHYPLLFPEGEDSWCISMASSINMNEPMKQLSVHDFYVYHLHECDDE